MLNRSAPTETGDAMLDLAIAGWSTHSHIASLFMTQGTALLVLDEAGERVLRASNGAASLRAAVSDPEGHLIPRLRFAEQIRRTGLSDTRARLVRIRLDPRGIARPTPCLIARAEPAQGISDLPVILLVPIEPLPVLRALPAGPVKEILPIPSGATGDAAKTEAITKPFVSYEAAVVQSRRFVWRSDADGVFTKFAGVDQDLVATLTGRSWQMLMDQGVIVGDVLFNALLDRQTFRALPLVVRPARAKSAIELEVSGAPAARPGHPFAGFVGFGHVRASQRSDAVTANAAGEMTGAAAPELGGTRASDVELASAPMDEPAAFEKTADGNGRISSLGEPDAPVSQAAFGASEAATRECLRSPIAPASETVWEAEAEGGADVAISLADVTRSSRGADLSIHEHAAFREIARALGARFAGDDEARQPQDRVAADRERGAVMPFPSSAPLDQNAAVEAAIVAALDRLPAGVLVHRGGLIMFANRRVLELTGFENRAAMQAAGGLTLLFRDWVAWGADHTGDNPIPVTSGSGDLTGLLVERSQVEWEGKPAELLLVRAANAVDPLREQAAQALFQVREVAKEREARVLLDQVEEGVVTLDETGRVLTLNRSATALLAGDARGIVGELLADLFSPQSIPLVASSLREARETGTSTPRRVVLDGQTAALRLRIVGLPATRTRQFCATLTVSPSATSATSEASLADMPVAAFSPRAEAKRTALPHRSLADGVRAADFLARLSNEICAPLNGILGFADAMMSEQFGPFEGERYHEYLHNIRTSGEYVLGVVEDLSDLARIEAGQIELAFAEVALNDVVSTCIAQMQPRAARDRIVVRSSLSPDVGPLSADERSMRQAALNVIAHALRYTEAGGQVIVSTTAAERGEIAFRVRDTGIGMSDDEIADALEPFRRGEVVAARHPGGTNLGLTLTKALVEANRGQFRISSRKNEGTLVEMTFPPLRARSA